MVPNPARAVTGHHSRFGFTLIEVLIVIVVIAMLIGLLIPSAMIVRRFSQRAGCASNLRQIGVMTSAYCDDHAGRFPPFHDGSYWGTFDCCKQMKDYLPEAGYRIYLCPASAGKPKLWGDWDGNAMLGGPYMFAQECAYGWNQHVRGNYQKFYWWNQGPSATNEISNASRVFWAVDAHSPRFDVFYGPYFVSGYRHGGQVSSDWVNKPGASGFNASFVDGHVEWINYRRWMECWTSYQWWGESSDQKYQFRGIDTF
ncbi:MAG: prepilin-type N-terminal cleavage/methylation domain-containing protein [Planctomycetes bacterium]|nr:prepilin-type N-terminal cleavage/methylation domain-containing protein [Planctomycetota bacterium]